MSLDNAVCRRVHAFLQARQAQQCERRLPACPTRAVIDFSTNSYCNLQNVEEVRARALRLCEDRPSGNLASRLISASSPLFTLLEEELASWKKTECALLFNSGYVANLSILQALCTRHTVVFSDRLNHTSIIDGIRLSGARMVRYNHNDIDDLACRLTRESAPEKVIVCDTVFSMDGDRAPLDRVYALARTHGALLMIDEAHACGVWGATLAGCGEKYGIPADEIIAVGTLSKAVGGLGGFFAGSREIRDYLVNTARGLIYSTALPHAVLAYDLAAVRHLRANLHYGGKVLATAADLREQLQQRGFSTMESTSQIIPCLTGSPGRTVALSRHLTAYGIKVPAIRPPTVPRGLSRLRFSVHTGISGEDITKTMQAIDTFDGTSAA